MASYVLEVRHRLVGALALYCGSQDVAEEAAQEALSRLWQRWDTVERRDAWLYRVGFNLLRSRARRRVIELKAHARLSRPAGDEERQAAFAEGAPVRTALARLPAREREALVRRFFLDQSTAGISLAMGCAEGTVKATIHHGLGHLRLMLPSRRDMDQDGMDQDGMEQDDMEQDDALNHS